jgi:predicted nucleic acid-binding Zn ribbon protein
MTSDRDHPAVGPPGGVPPAGAPVPRGERPPARRAGWGGRRRDGPVPLAEALGTVAERLGVGRADAVGAVFAQWDELVGPALAGHVRPVRLDGDTLSVTADHQAWAVEVRRLTPQLLARMAERCGPAAAPERIEVRVRPPRQPA